VAQVDRQLGDGDLGSDGGGGEGKFPAVTGGGGSGFVKT
jgi:hypothetical protein